VKTEGAEYDRLRDPISWRRLRQCRL